MVESGPSSYLKERYSSDAEIYDELWSPVIRPAGEALIEAMRLHDARRVLDAGIGVGALVPAIRRSAPNASVFGLDLARGMANLAVRRRHVPCVVGDAMTLPFATASVDAVVLAYVLFHLPRPAAAMSDAARVVRQSGAVGTITWAVEDAIDAGALLEAALDDAKAPKPPWSGDHEGLNSVEQVRAIFSRAGLDVRSVRTVTVEHQFTMDSFLTCAPAAATPRGACASWTPRAAATCSSTFAAPSNGSHLLHSHFVVKSSRRSESARASRTAR